MINYLLTQGAKTRVLDLIRISSDFITQICFHSSLYVIKHLWMKYWGSIWIGNGSVDQKGKNGHLDQKSTKSRVDRVDFWSTLNLNILISYFMANFIIESRELKNLGFTCSWSYLNLWKFLSIHSIQLWPITTWVWLIGWRQTIHIQKALEKS